MEITMNIYPFFLHYFSVFSLLAGLLTGVGCSWIYMGLRLKAQGLSSRQQTFYTLGILITGFGLFLYLLLLFIYIKNVSNRESILIPLFLVISLFISLLISIPSILFLRRRIRN